ncbi:uncharacterized protein SPPG_06363 [Spizellomyces punctatus DAOM BR117]|uniref:Velvet domain-containing protein n=1 Tax=Spizellomyces punctatus (strain DAOM BR117) TaxID=645134 RepID=A0A0L0HAT9_SPIPD|nr:uncharacterized protein SPPG_06363 [Spizellomyces punctatus DAOM BR117]KNC98680.1 hypothetical protein SPPG_06363 [Spizellomyces punctatus DAOM BR117]|eukprot:XP_016606720.1 hypothetical protein SPPG_06363 [Spizellomyces punctatus DAOM BR117]
MYQSGSAVVLGGVCYVCYSAAILFYPALLTCASGSLTLAVNRTVMASPSHHVTEGSSDGGRFKLILRQQPKRARMCGFSDTKDRRLVDPPPVLQLIFVTDGEDVLVRAEETPRWICHVALYSPDGTEDCSIVVNPRAIGSGSDEGQPAEPPSGTVSDRKRFRPWCTEDSTRDPLTAGVTTLINTSPLDATSRSGSSTPDQSRYYQSLVGSTVVPCEILRDPDGQLGMFFVFHDLSVRTKGQYRLKFLLVQLNLEGKVSEAKGSVMTDILDVFPPKTFPGMTESTRLSKCFARQGVPIHIRQDYSTSREPLAVLPCWTSIPEEEKDK